MTTPLARATACGMGTGPAPISKTGSDGRIESRGSSVGTESQARAGGVVLLGDTASDRLFGSHGAARPARALREVTRGRLREVSYAGPRGGLATWPIGIKHDDRSKIMNSSAFSCGVKGCIEHSPGTTPPVIEPVSSG